MQCRALNVHFTDFMFHIFQKLFDHTDALFTLSIVSYLMPDRTTAPESTSNFVYQNFFPSLRYLRIVYIRNHINISHLVPLAQLQTLVLEQFGIRTQANEILRTFAMARDITLVELLRWFPTDNTLQRKLSCKPPIA